jgi:hypothetical protein
LIIYLPHFPKQKNPIEGAQGQGWLVLVREDYLRRLKKGEIHAAKEREVARSRD